MRSAWRAVVNRHGWPATGIVAIMRPIERPQML